MIEKSEFPSLFSYVFSLLWWLSSQIGVVSLFPYFHINTLMSLINIKVVTAILLEIWLTQIAKTQCLPLSYNCFLYCEIYYWVDWLKYFISELTHSTWLQMDKCSQCHSLQMLWLDQGFLVMHAKSTPWVMGRLCVQ